MTAVNTVMLGVGVSLLGIGICLIWFYQRRQRNPLFDRLGNGKSERFHPISVSSVVDDEQVPRWWHNVLLIASPMGEKLSGSERDREKMRQLLRMGGYHSYDALGLFMAIKFLTASVLVLFLLFVVLEAEQRFAMEGLAFGLMAFFIGSTLPEWILKWQVGRRGERLARSVPDGLDLMVICAEAGLPLGRILQVVSKELALSSPELAKELKFTLAELTIANDRSQALRNLGNRTRVKEIESMVSTLIQAELYGTPLSQALNTISEDSRKKLILGLEEKAGKLPAQMSVPLMTLILPPIVVIMGAPALVKLIRMLSL